MFNYEKWLHSIIPALLWIYKEQLFEGLKLNPALIFFHYLTNSCSKLKSTLIIIGLKQSN